MQNIRISKGFALTVTGILFVWFLGPHIIFSASKKSHDQSIHNYEQQIDDRKNRVLDSIETLALKDLNLKACITALAMERARIHPSNSGGIDDVRELKNIYCPRKDIADLDGIENLQQISFLDVSNNAIRDISPLEPLSTLKSLHISGNPIENIYPLKNLISLREVGLPDLSEMDCDEIKAVIENIKTNLPATHCIEKQKPEENKPLFKDDPKSYNLSSKEEEELLDYEFERSRRLD